MAIMFNAVIGVVITSEDMPSFHTVEKLTSVTIGARSKPSGIGFEEVEYVMVDVPELFSKGWVLCKENRSTHSFYGRTDEQVLDKAVQVLALNPVVTKIEPIYFFREQVREAVAHAFQARTIEEADCSFSILVVVTIFRSDTTAAGMGLGVDARTVAEVDFHGWIRGGEKFFQSKKGHSSGI